MTREEFDKKQWHKDMRCFIETEVNGKTKKSYGTIVKVHFGGQFVGVRFDGKDYVERIGYARAKGRVVRERQVMRGDIFAYVTRRGESEMIIL